MARQEASKVRNYEERHEPDFMESEGLVRFCTYG